MNIVDALLLCFIFFVAMICAFRGFVDVVFGKFAFVAGLLAAFYFCPLIAPLLTKITTNKVIDLILAFFIIFVVVFMFLKICQLIINAIFSGVVMGSLNHALGFLFGIIEGCLFVCLLFIFIKAQPWFQVSPILNESFLYNLFLPVLQKPVNRVSGILV